MPCSSYMTINPRIPTIPRRSKSDFYRPSRNCMHQARSTVKRSASRMKSELHPTKNRVRGGLAHGMTAPTSSFIFQCVWGGQVRQRLQCFKRRTRLSFTPPLPLSVRQTKFLYTSKGVIRRGEHQIHKRWPLKRHESRKKTTLRTLLLVRAYRGARTVEQAAMKTSLEQHACANDTRQNRRKGRTVSKTALSRLGPRQHRMGGGG